MNKKSLFLFAGEQSGDVLGGNLVRALKQTLPTLDTYGVGGSQMQDAGLRLIHPMERFQVMGFADVIKSLPRLYVDFRKILRVILREDPTGVLLIDYPDFNMRLAKALRKRGYRGKVIHYVSPSVWAWRHNRVHSLANTLDHLLSILPFEKEYYSGTSLPVTYVGHPLVAAIDNHIYDPNWQNTQQLIAIFPGSRKHEIELNLPLQLAAAQKLGNDYTIAVSVARPELTTLIQKYVDPTTPLVPCEKRYELMRSATCALATSGTILLELGLHGIPTVPTYEMTPLNHFLGRYIFRIRLPFYTLVNIICQQEVYPEVHPVFKKRALFPTKIAEVLQQLLKNPEPCKEGCARLRHLLTTENASQNAATLILKELS